MAKQKEKEAKEKGKAVEKAATENWMAGKDGKAEEETKTMGGTKEQGESKERGREGEEMMEEMSRRFLQLVEECDRGEEASGIEEEVKKGRKKGHKRGEEASLLRKGNEGEDTERREAVASVQDTQWGDGFEFVSRLAEVGSSLGRLGVCMAWMICHKQKERRLKAIWGLLAGMNAGPLAVHRSCNKGAYSLRLGRLRDLWEKLVRLSFQDAAEMDLTEELKEESWLFCSVQCCNFLILDAGEPGKREF